MLGCQLRILRQFASPPIPVPSQRFRHDVGCGIRPREPEVRSEKQERGPPVHEVGERECHLTLHGEADFTPERGHLGVEWFQPGGIVVSERKQIAELVPVQPAESFDDRRPDPGRDQVARTLGVVGLQPCGTDNRTRKGYRRRLLWGSGRGSEVGIGVFEDPARHLPVGGELSARHCDQPRRGDPDRVLAGGVSRTLAIFANQRTHAGPRRQNVVIPEILFRKAVADHVQHLVDIGSRGPGTVERAVVFIIW